MDKLISSITGNLHIIRRLVSGFIVFAFLAFAVERLPGVDLASHWTTENANNILVGVVFLFSAYLLGSVTENAGNNSLLYVASIFAYAFTYPVRKFRWLPLFFRIIAIVYWWILASWIMVPIIFLRRFAGGNSYQHRLEPHLDGAGKTLFASLSPAVQYGLTHPVSVHSDHANEDILSRCGDRRPAMEALMNRQSDVAAVFSASLIGFLVYFSVSLYTSNFNEVPIFEPPKESNESSESEDPAGAESEGSVVEVVPESEDEPIIVLPEENESPPVILENSGEIVIEDPVLIEEPVIIVEEVSSFPTLWTPFVVAAFLPVIMLMSYALLSFRKNASINLVQTAANANGIKPQGHIASRLMYVKRRKSKATKFVSRAFWLAFLVALPIEWLRWNLADIPVGEREFYHLLPTLPDSFRVLSDNTAHYIIGKLYWAAVMAATLFVYLAVFAPTFGTESSPNLRSRLTATLLFTAVYFLINLGIGAIPRGISIPSWGISAVVAARHSLGFVLGGYIAFLSLSDARPLAKQTDRFARHVPVLVRLALAAFAIEYAIRQGAQLTTPLFNNFYWVSPVPALREAAYFGGISGALIIVFGPSRKIIAHRLIWLTGALLWLCAAVLAFTEPTWSNFDLGDVLGNSHGVNLHLPDFMRLNFGWIIVTTIGTLILARIVHYALPAYARTPASENGDT
ncbi:hypothetical protein [Shimia isoporae]|nr:hypothetical protein [Shimia isoporae]